MFLCLLGYVCNVTARNLNWPINNTQGQSYEQVRKVFKTEEGN